MRYAEYPPPDALLGVLHCLWTFEDDGAAREPQRIVPDGRCELVIHLGEPYREVGASSPQPRVLFAGQLTQPLWLEATGPCSVIGVRFRPAGAHSFVGGSMRSATDRRVALDEMAPGLSAALLAALSVTGPDARVETATAWVRERIGRAGVSVDDAVAAAAERIERSGGDVDVEELAASSGLGRRTLERRFAEIVGISPALLANVFRFRRVFDLIEHDSSRPWTDAALAGGYFDQSHLIRDFRRFVGCTPTEFAASRPGLASALVD